MFKTIDTQSLPRAVMSGIRPAILKNLGPLVILSGPNGGGKTRFFSLLEEARTSAAFDNQALRKEVADLTRRREYIEEQLMQNVNPGLSFSLRNVIAHIEAYEHRLSSPIELADGTNNQFAVVVLPPLAGGLGGSPENLTITQMGVWESEIDLQPAHGLGRIIHHLAGVVNSLYQAKHPDHKEDPAVTKRSERAKAFIDLIRELMDVEISYEVELGFPLPTLNGRRFAPAELSSGQSVLLAWAVVIETRVWLETQGRAAIRPRLVVAIDEPENHLHPKAAVNIIQRIIRYIGSNGQVWISTHSPTILAAFARGASVYHIADGQIEYASANLTKVIEGLVGGEAERHMMRDMLDDADRVAFYKFAVECLQNALIVGDADGRDPQSRQLSDVIRARLNRGDKLRVLDYASGKARFAMALAEILSEPDRGKVDYRTYDDPTFDTFRDDKLKNLARLYPLETSAEIAVRASNQLSDFKHEERVDVVVLCNALHEIESSEWFSLFQGIRSVLSESGVLLILEDLEMPVGELPNRSGYLVLDLADLRELFGSSREVQPVRSDAHSRCSAVSVSYAALAPFSEGGMFRAGFEVQLGKALDSVRARALAEIKRMRAAGDANHANGRRHARASMLLANVEIARNR